MTDGRGALAPGITSILYLGGCWRSPARCVIDGDFRDHRSNGTLPISHASEAPSWTGGRPSPALDFGRTHLHLAKHMFPV